jgi:hypothetical protein
MTIGFGLLHYLISKLVSTALPIKYNIIVAIFFGIFLSLFTVSYQLYALKRKGVNQFDNDTLSARQKGVFQSNLNINELSDLLINDQYFSKMKINYTDGLIKLSSGASMESWGELISIKLIYNRNMSYRYKFTCRPKFRPTIIDYGKNYIHKRELMRLVDNRASFEKR